MNLRLSRKARPLEAAARSPERSYFQIPYSAFFLRRNTMIPINRIASTAQTTRTVEVSIVFLLSRQE
jgi:hypothetical protein